jgi:hypothetical protein
MSKKRIIIIKIRKQKLHLTHLIFGIKNNSTAWCLYNLIYIQFLLKGWRCITDTSKYSFRSIFDVLVDAAAYFEHEALITDATLDVSIERSNHVDIE